MRASSWNKTLFFVGCLLPVLFSLVWGGTALGVSITVRDSMGREVRVPLPVKRVVALNSDVLEVIRTLEAQDLVVGVFSEVVREREFWGDLATKAKAGSWREAGIETIVTMNPDLVVAYSRNPGPELENKLAAFGISVLRLDFYKVESLKREVKVLGRVLGRERQAERFCKWLHLRLGEISKGLEQASKRPLVYVESYTDFHTVGPGSGGHQMCVVAGGINIASGFSIPYPRVTPEWVVAQDPDVIVKAAAWGGGYTLRDAAPFNRLRDAIIARPAWHQIRAVATGRVYVMDSAIWAGPRAVIGLGYLARWFHPRLFSGLDPAAWHKEYLESFQGIPFKGVYVSESPDEVTR